MKVDYIDPFVRAARSTLEQLSGSAATAGPPSLLGTTFAASPVNIVCRVSGGLEGEAVYSMSTLTARELATLIAGTEPNTFGQVMGRSLAQLGSAWAKGTRRMLSEMGFDCKISDPIVFQGLNVEFDVDAPALAVEIETEAGRVEVSVAVKDGR